MKLHWSPRSPFVRKVTIVLHETDQLSEVDLVRSVVALPSPPNQDLLADNPLNKIPTLVIDNGLALFDSRVICEYLDTRAQGGLHPKDLSARMQHLRWQALADGLTDLLLLWRTELTRESGPFTAITDGWLIKAQASMAALESDAPELSGLPFGIGHISVVCALGQMDFRWRDCDWRAHFPKLAALNDELSQRTSVKDTDTQRDETPGASEVTAGHFHF